MTLRGLMRLEVLPIGQSTDTARSLWLSASVSFILIFIVVISLCTAPVCAAELQQLATTYLGADQGVFVEAVITREKAGRAKGFRIIGRHTPRFRN